MTTRGNSPENSAGACLHRPRRLRRTGVIRDLVAETALPPQRLVLPLFIVEGKNLREPIATLPGVDRVSVDEASRDIGAALELGVGAFALFPKIPDDRKSRDASAALDEDGLVCRALRTLRAQAAETCLITDVALDPYSSDGHDGIVDGGRVLNDETVDMLATMASAHARAGADFVAPSDMMDGRVRAIRRRLDGQGHTETGIISYAVKYASSFYGPFRDALGSAPVERPGVPADKKSYQMDPANADEALREAEIDEEEGADVLLVKPALPYLDVVSRIAAGHRLPVAAYHVSGEYAMLRFAAEKGAVEYRPALAESLISIARAGARMIFTYGALDYADWWRRRHGIGA